MLNMSLSTAKTLRARPGRGSSRSDHALQLGEAALQEPLLGTARRRELKRFQVGTPRRVAAAEAAQEVRTSRWQQVVAGQGLRIQSVQCRQAGLVAVPEADGN